MSSHLHTRCSLINGSSLSPNQAQIRNQQMRFPKPSKSPDSPSNPSLAQMQMQMHSQQAFMNQMQMQQMQMLNKPSAPPSGSLIIQDSFERSSINSPPGAPLERTTPNSKHGEQVRHAAQFDGFGGKLSRNKFRSTPNSNAPTMLWGLWLIGTSPKTRRGQLLAIL